MRLLAALAFLLVPSIASATLHVDTFGGDYWDGTNASRTWVNIYDVDVDCTLEDIDINWGSTQLASTNRQVTFGVWKWEAAGWVLQWSHAMSMPLTGTGVLQWEEGPPDAIVSVPMEAGSSYAIGLYALRQIHLGYTTTAVSMPQVAWGEGVGRFNTFTAGFPTSLPNNSTTSGGYGQILTVNVAFDNDGDGVDSDTDCDDNDASRYPGNAEVCDGVDNDCVGGVPADEADADFDGAHLRRRLRRQQRGGLAV